MKLGNQPLNRNLGTRRRAQRPPCVLVAEDEPMVGVMLADELADRGFIVRLVTSGEEGLTALQNEGPFDALFTDINLAGTMDGWDLARAARERFPLLPVLYASGRWMALDPMRAVEGAQLLRKPYSLAEAATMLRLLMRASSEPSSARQWDGDTLGTGYSSARAGRPA